MQSNCPLFKYYNIVSYCSLLYMLNFCYSLFAFFFNALFNIITTKQLNSNSCCLFLLWFKHFLKYKKTTNLNYIFYRNSKAKVFLWHQKLCFYNYNYNHNHNYNFNYNSIHLWFFIFFFLLLILSEILIFSSNLLKQKLDIF